MHETDTQSFTRFLKKLGKQTHVIGELTRQVGQFESFLAARGKTLAHADQQEVLDYVAYLEAQVAGSARLSVRGVALYYKFLGQPALAAAFSQVRQAAIAKTRKAFALAEFRGVAPEHIARLKQAGVQTADQMLKAGATLQLRQQLAEQSGVPVETILELVKLSDLSRLSGVKAIRARLYYDAGADTVAKIAAFEPEELLKLTAEFVQRTGFDGIAPLPKEVRSTIETARQLPKLITE